MPKYEYACTECGERLEVVQKFADDPLTECPACGGRLRKLFSAVGVVFKGSGFYRTDSRASAGSGARSGEGGGSGEPSSNRSAEAAKGDSPSDGRSTGAPKAESKAGPKGSSKGSESAA